MNNWCFLRGLGRAAIHWGDFPARLCARLSGVTLTIPDNPGVGSQIEKISPVRVEGIRDVVRRSTPTPVVLVGISLGGMIALSWARDYPEEVAGLVLINTSALDFSHPLQRMRPLAVARLISILGTSDIAARERKIWKYSSNQPPHEDILKVWTEAARAHQPRKRLILRQMRAAVRFKLGPVGIMPPTLVLSSRGDGLVHHSCGERLAARVGAEFHLHTSAGHDLPLDAPEWVEERIVAWAGKNSVQ